MRPAGCLLSLLALLGGATLYVLGLGMLLLLSFNDNGDPQAAAALEHTAAVVRGLGIGTLLAGLVGAGLALVPARGRRVPPSPTADPDRSGPPG